MPQVLAVADFKTEFQSYVKGTVITISDQGLIDHLRARRVISTSSTEVAAAVAGGARLVTHTRRWQPSMSRFGDLAAFRAAEKAFLARGSLIRCPAWDLANQVITVNATTPIVRRLANGQMIMYTGSGQCGAAEPAFNATGPIQDGTATAWALGQVSTAAPSTVPVPAVSQVTGGPAQPVVYDLYANADSVRRLLTPNIVKVGSNTAGWLYRNGASVSPIGLGNGLMAYKDVIEFDTESPLVEITYFPGGSGLIERPRVRVDDYWVEEVPSPYSGSVGGTKRLIVDYTAVAPRGERRWWVEVPAGVGIRSLSCPAGYTIKPADHPGLIGIVNMDSYGRTVSVTLPASSNIDTNFAPSETAIEQAMRDLGIRHVLNMHEGGTGYAVNGTNGRLNVRDLIMANDMSSYDVSYAVFFAGGNDIDGAISPAVAAARAGEAWRERARQHPRCLIHVHDVFPADEQGSATRHAMSAALLAEFKAWNYPLSHFDSPLTGYSYAPGVGEWNDGPLVTGSGRVGSTTGVGTSDIYTGIDSAHASPPGKALYRNYFFNTGDRAMRVRGM